ncbi:DEAD/DEAH box helicase [Nesterenkonia aurantiaca]|uniref:ATP-dependent RNA helicase DeaD n=1 Tax=Nesterenkonia aurantiaca TaxID=1436010 RepID=A0A4R7G2L4_9MICC|nr:DEAD/DEAH box helicase [Nesterenkonia aurantiaca]TDS85471.1 ATP-dependent RNA helicase CsdA [Nesterenkonia aurantiaca]
MTIQDHNSAEPNPAEAETAAAAQAAATTESGATQTPETATPSESAPAEAEAAPIVTEAPVTVAPAAPAEQAPAEEAPAAPAEQAPAEEAPAAPAEQAPAEEAPAAPAEQAPKAAEQAPKAEEEPTGPKFSELGLDARVLQSVTKLGYETPSPIQAQTIPLLSQGRDVVGLAQTGTGKTAAFALPALSHMARANDAGELGNSPSTLVLAPTRELAIQVAEAFATYAQGVPGITVLPIYGGSPYGPQLEGLRRGAHVVVGTPGRVIDHMTRGSLNLSTIKHLVLDEADEMLRMGFAEEVDQILARTPKTKQVALFSATMPKAIRRISADYLNDPVEVSVKSKTSTGTNTRQRFVLIKHSAKNEALNRILETEPHDAAIVFVRTRSATEEVSNKLAARGFRTAAINGDIPQNLREKTVENLKSGRIDILVATDVAARGLDVERITHVFNYDIPLDTESYVHRIGRTGRAGRSGDAVLFVTPREKRMLRSIEKATRQPVEQMSMPTIADVNSSRLDRFSERITQTLASEELEEYRGLVASYTHEHNTPAEDVAAALVAMVHDGRPLLLDEKRDDELVRESKREVGEDRGGDRPERPQRDRGPRTAGPGNAMYKIAVGRRNGVNPGHIVGAIANEAGLSAREIGGIDIRPTHSLVELPEKLSSEQWAALAKTRIGGELLKMERDTGAPSGGTESRGGYGESRGGYAGKREGGSSDRGGRAGSGDSRFGNKDRKPRWK